MPKTDPFEGLFGVFADSLPDGWGRLLVDRLMRKRGWILSPAYDLTRSSSIGGEHATTVNGNGVNPGMEDVLAVAGKIGLNVARARKTASNIRDCVLEMLDEYVSKA